MSPGGAFQPSKSHDNYSTGECPEQNYENTAAAHLEILDTVHRMRAISAMGGRSITDRGDIRFPLSAHFAEPVYRAASSRATSSDVLRTLNFAIMFARWTSTVRGEQPIDRAISLLVKPLTRYRAIRTSAAVRL